MRKIFLYSQWRIQDFPGGNAPSLKYHTYQSNICICPTDYPALFHHGKHFSLLSDPTMRHLSGLRFRSAIREVESLNAISTRRPFGRSPTARCVGYTWKWGGGVSHEVWRAFQPYHQILSMLKHVRGVKGRNNL